MQEESYRYGKSFRTWYVSVLANSNKYIHEMAIKARSIDASPRRVGHQTCSLNRKRMRTIQNKVLASCKVRILPTNWECCRCNARITPRNATHCIRSWMYVIALSFSASIILGHFCMQFDCEVDHLLYNAFLRYSNRLRWNLWSTASNSRQQRTIAQVPAPDSIER